MPLDIRCNYFHNKTNKNKCKKKNCLYEHNIDNELPSNNKININIYKNHILKNGKIGWKTKRSYEERIDRRIKTELPGYLVQEKINQEIYYLKKKIKEEEIADKNYLEKINLEIMNEVCYTTSGREYSPTAPLIIKYDLLLKRKNELIEYQPRLNIDSDWFESKSKKLIFNGDGLIYYVNKLTGEKSWIHPYTDKTNLPGGYKSPMEAGLI
jgi:hypothetical protein